LSDATDQSRADQQPSARMKWLARVLCWLCWAGIAVTAFTLIVRLLDLDTGLTRSAFPASTGFFESRVTIPDDPDLIGLRADWFYRIAGIVPASLFIWALFSARRSFAGISRGEYFGRPTILGLRNFALAVLLYLTLAPIVIAAARAWYASQFKGAMVTFALQLSPQIQLSIIFPLAVVLISSVMVRAARIAEENRQFV
jgi:hypothetical protein